MVDPLFRQARTTKPERLVETRREPAQFAPAVDPPRGVLHAPEARDSSFFHQRLAPAPLLAPFVQHFWYVQWDRRDAASGSAETLPHPSCYLVFEHDLERPVDDAAVLRCTEVSGVHTGKFSRTMEGCGRVFGVKFQPGGLFPFLQGSVSVLTDRVVPAHQVFGSEIHTLARDLRALQTPEDMVAAATQFLASRAPERDPASETATDLVKLILDDPAVLTVDGLSHRSGLSVRALQRLFKTYVGVSPKWVIRRYRLHELLECLNSSEHFDGVQIALDLGYADQAHLIHDFTKLVGMPPTAYLRRLQR